MPVLGVRRGELRIVDTTVTWRILYRADPDAIVIGAVFAKKTPATPADVIAACKQRFRTYDELMDERSS
jgi:phage-related protein